MREKIEFEKNDRTDIFVPADGSHGNPDRDGGKQ